MIGMPMEVLKRFARALRGSFSILNLSLITPLKPTRLQATPGKTKRKMLHQLIKRINNYRR
jgi:hypothetical protein